MEFVCRDINATVRSANVRATFDAFLLVPSAGQRLMARHKLKLDDLAADPVVPVQRWLDALKEIHQTVGAGVVRHVGMRIIENADFPPHLPTTTSILEALDAIYYVNHSGDVGHYRCRRQGDAFVIRCETPYPADFERGLVEGICRHKRSGGRRYSVGFELAPPGGDLTCTLTVRPC